MRIFATLPFALTLFSVPAVLAQAVTVQGVVFDSLHGRPLVGAAVSIGSLTATTDSLGRFVFDGIAAGEYRVTAQHEALDQLGLSAIGARVHAGNGTQTVRLSVPSFETLWRLECGPKPPGRDTGFVFGTVSRASGSGTVSATASWIDLSTRGSKITQKLRTMDVAVDSLGNFALCGIPTTTGFSIAAVSTDSFASGSFDLPPLDRERVLRRDLRLTDTRVKRQGSIAGVVLADSTRTPLADAEVSLPLAGMTTRSNQRGEFTFGELSPGSYRVLVRKIGYAEVDVGVDIQGNDRRQQNVFMKKITLLDSVVTRGKFLARDEQMRVFEEHRKIGLGKFLTADELEKARALTINSLIIQWQGLRMTSTKGDPVSNRGIKSMTGGACLIPIYLDGIKLLGKLSDVPPETIAGVEYYAGPATTPVEYAKLGNQCGVLLLHSRYKTGK